MHPVLTELHFITVVKLCNAIRGEKENEGKDQSDSDERNKGGTSLTKHIFNKVLERQKTMRMYQFFKDNHLK